MLENNYTALCDPKINRKIEADLSVITNLIIKRLGGKISCILLGGGFGRGEGTVTIYPEIRPMNDYDIFAFCNERVPSKTGKELENDLIEILSVPLVDVLLYNKKRFKLTQFTYDVRFGSILLWGMFPEALQKIRKRDIPTLQDALVLFMNRLATLLESICRPKIRYSQTAKIILSCVDIRNILRRRYAVEYKEKVNIFLNGRRNEQVENALEYKLKGRAGNLDVQWAIAFYINSFSEIIKHMGYRHRFSFYIDYVSNPFFGFNLMRKLVRISALEAVLKKSDSVRLTPYCNKLSKIK